MGMDLEYWGETVFANSGTSGRKTRQLCLWKCSLNKFPLCNRKKKWSGKYYLSENLKNPPRPKEKGKEIFIIIKTKTNKQKVVVLSSLSPQHMKATKSLLPNSDHFYVFHLYLFFFSRRRWLQLCIVGCFQIPQLRWIMKITRNNISL